MAATPQEIADASADAQLELANRGAIKRIVIRGREVETHDPLSLAKAAALNRGLNSSKRGISVAQIERPQ